MYTYESFETLGAFTLLRPTLITILIVSLLLFIKVIFPKEKIKIINGFTIVSISIISIFISAQVLFYIGIIADEINLGGDPVSFNMFLIILGLSCINSIIYFYRHNERKE
jgi:hypothetical protein